jgi:hypothetical protein
VPWSRAGIKVSASAKTTVFMQENPCFNSVGS